MPAFRARRGTEPNASIVKLAASQAVEGLVCLARPQATWPMKEPVFVRDVMPERAPLSLVQLLKATARIALSAHSASRAAIVPSVLLDDMKTESGLLSVRTAWQALSTQSAAISVRMRVCL